ncbi:MAG TPA: cyanophycin synthetase [Flavobacterium sp.]|jgi:cyanophycin synthetase
MKILKTQVLRGPNIWSNYRKKLIQLRLDLEEMENFPTDKIPGFRERIEAMFPEMIEHECSEGVRGGFFDRVERGTWLGHVMEHIALEIQTRAGMQAGYGRTRGTGTKGIYHVVFAYTIEEAGLYAAQAAFRITEALSTGAEYDYAADIEKLRDICQKYDLGPSTKSMVEAAEKRGIPWTRIGSNSSIRLGYGKNQMQFQATITCRTSVMAVEVAGDKAETKLMLSKAKIPVPEGGSCRSEEDFKIIVNKIGYPLVIKPLDGNQGKGASINVTNWDAALKGFKYAKEYSNTILIERFATGYDFRMLVIDHKFVAAAKRVPAHVTGNGTATIAELIAEVNLDPRRGRGHQNVLTKITVDRDTEELLQKMKYTLQSVPAKDEVIYLKSTANLSTGGTATDVTDNVHPDNIRLAERISKVIGLDICGIDVMAENLSEPMKETKGVVLEVNAAPGFRMHLAPSEGKARDVGAAVIDMLYPPGRASRIPLIAITGTNGKTTTTRIMAHMAKSSGHKVGYTTTDGIYINDALIEEGDTTGPLSGNFVLADPTIDFAVLETARGGILRSGLCFNECDIAIVTNIKEDHLGMNDINTIEDLANVKAVVPRSVKKDGWAILNAEDEHCRKISEELDCNVAWFSLNPENEFVRAQASAGNPIAIYENGYISILQGNEQIRIESVSNIPITYGGSAKFMIANSLAAALAGFLWGFSTEGIRHSLQTFMPGFEQTPGRLNLFEFKKFKVLVDYAHNPHGYAAIEEYLGNVKANKKIGIISGIGDRRDEDIKHCAQIACRMFDHVIIRQEHDLRGRSEQNINALLLEGILESCKNVNHEIISEETEAIKRAMSIAGEGDMIIALSDQYKSVVEIVKNELRKENSLPHPALQKKSNDGVPRININNPNINYHGRTA